MRFGGDKLSLKEKKKKKSNKLPSEEHYYSHIIGENDKILQKLKI